METFNIFAARGVWDSENERDGCRHAGEQTWPLQELEPGHVVAFPEGPAGARQVRNVTDESVRVVFFSSKSPLAIVHYPDSGARNTLALRVFGGPWITAVPPLAASAFAWIVLVAQPFMAEDVAPYVALWSLMMTAMMLPSVVPLAALYPRVRDTAALAVAYLAVWAATGFAAYAVEMSVGVRASVVLAAAAAYELTPLKSACLKRCRAPVDFVVTRWRGGRLGALRLGLEHASYCLGCCWALMAVLVLAAAMSLAWAAVLAAVVFVQKVLPLPAWTSRATAVALALAAVVVEVS